MKKNDLIDVLKEQTGVSKKDADKALTAVFDAIINAVAAGEKVQISGFGTFEQRQRNARTGVNPRTGNSIDISASKVPAFKAGKAFKDIVNQ